VCYYCGDALFQKRENAFITTYGISASLRSRLFSSKEEPGLADKVAASSQQSRDSVSGFQVFANDDKKLVSELRASEFRNFIEKQKMELEQQKREQELNAYKKKNEEELEVEKKRSEQELNAYKKKNEEELEAEKKKRELKTRFFRVVGLVVVIVRNSLHDLQNMCS
jgi:hypothetical protein